MKCSAEGCTEYADPRWWMHAKDGSARPSCDGHGCLAQSEGECRCRVRAELESAAGVEALAAAIERAVERGRQLERAAVVAWLRDSPSWSDAHEWFVPGLERGDHVRYSKT